MRQHWDVAAINSVGGCFHSLREETFQFRLHRVVVVGHDIPAWPGLPGDAGSVPTEEVGCRGIVRRPDNLLLFLRKISREELDAFRLHPETPITRFDVPEYVGRGVRSLLALRCLAGVTSQSQQEPYPAADIF